jgi:hypothetical protein
MPVLPCNPASGSSCCISRFLMASVVCFSVLPSKSGSGTEREREREGRARRSHLENRTYARQISRSEVRLDVLLLASLHKQARFRNAPLSDMDEGGHGVNSFIRMSSMLSSSTCLCVKLRIAYVCVCVCVRVRACLCAHFVVCVYMYIYIYIYTHMHTNCVHVSSCLCVCVSHVHEPLFFFFGRISCTYYVYIYTHTHAHPELFTKVLFNNVYVTYYVCLHIMCA